MERYSPCKGIYWGSTPYASLIKMTITTTIKELEKKEKKKDLSDYERWLLAKLRGTPPFPYAWELPYNPP